MSFNVSIGFGPKIHLRGTKPSKLKYGGPGHRPPPFEELMVFGKFMDFISHDAEPFVFIGSLLDSLVLKTLGAKP